MDLRAKPLSDLRVLAFFGLGAMASLVLAIAIRLGFPSVPGYLVSFNTQILGTAVIYAAAFYALGVHQAANRRDYSLWVVTLGLANAIAWLISLAFVYLQGLDRIGRGIYLLFGVLHLFLFIGWYVLWAHLNERWFPPKRALIVGSGEPAQIIASLVRSTPKWRLYPVALLQIGDGKAETNLEDLPVYTGSAGLYQVAKMVRADCLVLTLPYKCDDDLVTQLLRTRLDGIEVLDSGDLYEAITGRISLNAIDDYWGLFLSLSRIRPINPTLKRTMDVVVAAGLLVVAAPIMACVALLIKILSPGPILYRQERLGQDGKAFEVLKFRTMVPNAEARTGAVWACEDDPRITGIGRFLRKWRLDELPQLVNVLKGEMSVVGPRPEREVFVSDFLQKVPVFKPGRRKMDRQGTYFFDGWREAINLYSTRLLVKPGVTGWAQVNCSYAASLEESREKLEYDLYYVKHQSILFDLSILMRTIGMLVWPNGR